MASLLAAALKRAYEHPLGPRGILIEEERARGSTIIPLGATSPVSFSSEDWLPGVLTRRGDEVRIVAIWARHPRSGAFRRLLASIDKAGLRPVVVAPIGDVMPQLMRRWKWRHSVAGHGVDAVHEWRPA